jgi:hypothetical protein
MAMNGTVLGDEIAEEIRQAVIEYLVLQGLIEIVQTDNGPEFKGAFLAFVLRLANPWINIIWRAIGRAIVAHIVNNLEVTVRVTNYSVGPNTDDFDSVEIK